MQPSAETDNVLSAITAKHTVIVIDNETKLALLSTCDATGAHHTRSVLCVRSESAPLVLVDNLRFSLILSVHEQLPIQALMEAMHQHYFARHYSDDGLQRLRQAILGPAATEEECDRPLSHPLYVIAASHATQYELHRGAQATGDDAGEDEPLQPPSPALYFIKSMEPFEPSRASVIYAKLKKGQAGTKKCALTRQYRLWFDNHLIAEYFVDKFQRPFYVKRAPCEVRVLCATPDRHVSYLDCSRPGAAQRHLLEQLPRFRHGQDAMRWCFTNAEALTPDAYLHRATSERAPPCLIESWQTVEQETRRNANRVAYNMLDFAPSQLCDAVCRVDYASRIQTVFIDSSEARNTTTQADEKTVQGGTVSALQLELEQQRATHYAVRTSAPKQNGQAKRMAQQTLPFTGSTKKPRLETSPTSATSHV